MQTIISRHCQPLVPLLNPSTFSSVTTLSSSIPFTLICFYWYSSGFSCEDRLKIFGQSLLFPHFPLLISLSHPQRHKHLLKLRTSCFSLSSIFVEPLTASKDFLLTCSYFLPLYFFSSLLISLMFPIFCSANYIAFVLIYCFLIINA